MPIRKSIRSRVPSPLAAMAAVLLVVTAVAGAKEEITSAGFEPFGWLGTKQVNSASDGGKSGEAFKSALFLFRLR